MRNGSRPLELFQVPGRQSGGKSLANGEMAAQVSISKRVDDAKSAIRRLSQLKGALRQSYRTGEAEPAVPMQEKEQLLPFTGSGEYRGSR